MVFLKKLLLFSLVQTKEILGRSIADQTLFTENSLPVDKEKEIYNINSIHGEIKSLSNNIESYEFDKNFRITQITESLQQINGKNGLIVLDHDKFYYFEIINFNKDLLVAFNNLFKKEIQEKKQNL